MLFDITYMWNQKKKNWYKWNYLQNRNGLTDRKQTYGYQSAKSGEIHWPPGQRERQCVCVYVCVCDHSGWTGKKEFIYLSMRRSP